MKKLLLLLTLLICQRAFAPATNSLVIIQPEVINPFKAILRAVGTIEAQNDTLAFNLEEQARGIYQIRPIRLVDYNRRTGKHYSRKDVFKPEVSKEIFLYYAEMFGPYDTDDMIRAWNGSGEATYVYLKNVKAKL